MKEITANGYLILGIQLGCGGVEGISMTYRTTHNGMGIRFSEGREMHICMFLIDCYSITSDR